jgi:hypothetical protein
MFYGSKHDIIKISHPKGIDRKIAYDILLTVKFMHVVIT